MHWKRTAKTKRRRWRELIERKGRGGVCRVSKGERKRKERRTKRSEGKEEINTPSSSHHPLSISSLAFLYIFPFSLIVRNADLSSLVSVPTLSFSLNLIITPLFLLLLPHCSLLLLPSVYPSCGSAATRWQRTEWETNERGVKKLLSHAQKKIIPSW